MRFTTWPRRGPNLDLPSLAWSTRRFTEEADLVRAKVRGVFRALELDSGEVKDRGYQQGFASPTAAQRRRAALCQLARACFLTLWRRAARMLAVTGRPQLHDDNEGCADAVMALM